MQQTIRFAHSFDGVKLAWATAGRGPTLVKASNWLTHLEFDWDSPVWRHWTRFLADNFHCIRYDERGCGMSEWRLEDATWNHWTKDFETIVEAAEPEPPFVLLGISQGGAAAISYAARYPENVSHLVLYGAYARGWGKRGDPDSEQRFEAITQLTRLGWGQDNPVYRQLFTSRFIPEGTPEQFEWFNEVCQRTTTPEIATMLLEARGQVDVTGLLADVKAPTLVIQARQDEICPLAEGVLLASEIPGARFVQLESRNHILLEHEPAWERFRDEVLEFTGIELAAGDENPAFEVLSPRERDIFVGIARGETNKAIGNRLFISDKTVRNTITRLFEKLGVSSRAQAIVMAKDGNLNCESD
jgi:pimeloyl-ACP methyl ester carboxylesterase/DNA-binding CsgD family transcriptional regulator